MNMKTLTTTQTIDAWNNSLYFNWLNESISNEDRQRITKMQFVKYIQMKIFDLYYEIKWRVSSLIIDLICRLWETRLGRWLCGRLGHRPIWYNPGELEPNMTCERCGEDCG